MYSRFDCVSPELPVGRFTLMPFICTWLKLTIMKLAKRKNMASINGMISMRALLCGIGEVTCIGYLSIDEPFPEGWGDPAIYISPSALCAHNRTSRFVAAVCSLYS